MAGFLLEEILETFDFHCVEIFSGDTDREIFIESLESLIARKIIEYVS